MDTGSCNLTVSQCTTRTKNIKTSNRLLHDVASDAVLYDVIFIDPTCSGILRNYKITVVYSVTPCGFLERCHLLDRIFCLDVRGIETPLPVFTASYSKHSHLHLYHRDKFKSLTPYFDMHCLNLSRPTLRYTHPPVQCVPGSSGGGG
jgi:hypothetical protein